MTPQPRTRGDGGAILASKAMPTIPVEQPNKFELVINLTAAKALSLTIPESFLLRANKLIE
jgi:putative tryptophan/tyrosine transport system substrate-binding protein